MSSKVNCFFSAEPAGHREDGPDDAASVSAEDLADTAEIVSDGGRINAGQQPQGDGCCLAPPDGQRAQG